jgi:hypothetical protein
MKDRLAEIKPLSETATKKIQALKDSWKEFIDSDKEIKLINEIIEESPLLRLKDYEWFPNLIARALSYASDSSKYKLLNYKVTPLSRPVS